MKFAQRVVGMEDNPVEDTVKVMAHEALDFNSPESHDGDLMHRAKYVVGTDGANSAVRRMLCIVSPDLSSGARK